MGFFKKSNPVFSFLYFTVRCATIKLLILNQKEKIYHEKRNHAKYEESV